MLNTLLSTLGRLLSILILCSLYSLSLSAKPAENIDKGVAWLNTQLDNTATYNNPTSLSTPHQNSTTTLSSFQYLQTTPPTTQDNTWQYLTTHPSEQNSEQLARSLITGTQTNQTVIELFNELLNRYNAHDSGIGDMPGYDSTILDTAYTLEAIAIYGVTAEMLPAIQPSLLYLLQQQQNDGGWSDGDNLSSLYTTAIALHALWQYRHHYPAQIDPVLDQARGFLLSQQQDAVWSETYLTAIALLAMLPTSNDITAFDTSIQTLVNLQNNNGSWANDIYTTALVLRTVHLYDGRINGLDINTGTGTTTGSITGRIVDAETGANLVGVSVSLNGTYDSEIITDADGRFLIANLQTGNYTLLLNQTGYNGLLVALNAEAGQVTNAGELILVTDNNAELGEIALNATIIDGLSNQGVSGAQVTLADNTSKLTNTAGKVNFSGITTTEFQVSVSAEGYADKTYTVSVAAFGTLNYTFALPPASIDPNAQSTHLSGTLTNEEGIPVANTQVSAAGQTAISDNAGRYTLNDIDRLTFILSVSVTGYVSKQLSVELGSHGNYTQNIQLTALPATGSLQITSLVPNTPSTGVNDIAILTAQIINTATEDNEVRLIARIFDAANETVDTALIREAGTSVAANTLTLASGDTSTIELIWHTRQMPAGNYHVVLTVATPDSITQDLPQGEVLVEAASAITLRAEKAFAGRTTFDPPLIQAGAQTPIKLTVFVLNAGNTALADETLTLTLNDADGTIIHTAQAQTGTLEAMEYALTEFGEWTPDQDTVGNLTANISAVNAAVSGEINSDLYIGNKASALYTVNKNIVPAGSSSVLGNINVTGVDVTQASVNDPLFFAVKEAVKRGADYTAVEAVAIGIDVNVVLVVMFKPRV